MKTFFTGQRIFRAPFLGSAQKTGLCGAPLSLRSFQNLRFWKDSTTPPIPGAAQGLKPSPTGLPCTPTAPPTAPPFGRPGHIPPAAPPGFLFLLKKILPLIIFLCAANLTAEEPLPPNISAAFKKAGLMVLAKPVSAKDFSLPLLGGGNRSLSSLKGKIVLLNFWATWCPPCREEMPSMETLYNKFKNEGLEFLTVTVDSKDAEEEVKAFMRSLRLSFPVALDPPGKVFALYNVRSIPTTYIVDRNGNIVAGAVGSRNWNSGEVSTAFEALLRRGP